MNTKTTNKTKILSSSESGMSLIELLISMVVGLFLLAGVVTNFLSTTQADIKRDAVSEMDANALVAFEYLRNAISHAGYPSIENIPMETPFHTVDQAIRDDFATSNKCRNGAFRDFNNIGANGKRYTRDNNNNGKDFLMVSSLADNPCLPGVARCDGPARIADINPAALVFSDCGGGGAERDELAVACSTDPDLGMDDSRDAKIYNAFWLLKNSSSPNDRVFYCEGNRSGRQAIIENVEAVQYLYGVRNAAGSTIYRRAQQVQDADQWAMVTSVQVALLLRSSKKYVLDQPSTKTRYNLLKQNVDIATEDLRRLFRIYTTTINLENRK